MIQDGSIALAVRFGAVWATSMSVREKPKSIIVPIRYEEMLGNDHLPDRFHGAYFAKI